MKIYFAFNIQLFATQTTLLNASGNDLSPEMKTFYDMTLIDMAEPELIFDQFGQKRPIPKGAGKKIEFRSFSPLPKAMTPLTEGVTPDGNKLNVTAIEAEVHQYGDYIVTSDMLELTALDPIIAETTQLLGRQGGATSNAVTRNVLIGGTNVMYAPKLDAAGAETEVTSRKNLDATCVLTADLVDQVVAKLRANNTPTIDGYYIGVIHPLAAYDLKKDPAWRNPHEYTDTENIYKGEIGMYGGVRFVENTEAKIWKDSTCPTGLAVFGSLFFGKDAYGVTEIEGGGMEVIVKAKGSAGTADPLNQRSSIGWKLAKTAEILVEAYMIRLEHCSKRYSATVAAN